MSLTIALASLLLVSTDNTDCLVTLVNSSSVDLSLSVGDRNVLLGPNESTVVPVTSLAAVDFGAMHHAFAVSPVLPTICEAGNSTEIEARSDGQLWLRGANDQPDGMPLRPVQLQDLTGSPPNNSFKPTPLRGAA